jgi:hypothetical protein
MQNLPVVLNRLSLPLYSSTSRRMSILHRSVSSLLTLLPMLQREFEGTRQAITYSKTHICTTTGRNSMHLPDLSIWASNRVPPVTTFSVAECRIRETRPLEECLGEALNISMYLNEGESPLLEYDYLASKESAPANRPYGRSTSGGSYMRAKEKALRQFGVITNSYSSARGSWRSENSGGVTGMRTLRGHTLEAIIDSMGLGDGDEIAAARQGKQSPDPVKPKEPLSGKTRSGASASRRSWNQTGTGDSQKGGDRTWRDLVVAQNDRFNPEYIDPDM